MIVPRSTGQVYTKIAFPCGCLFTRKVVLTPASPRPSRAVPRCHMTPAASVPYLAKPNSTATNDRTAAPPGIAEGEAACTARHERRSSKAHDGGEGDEHSTKTSSRFPGPEPSYLSSQSSWPFGSAPSGGGYLGRVRPPPPPATRLSPPPRPPGVIAAVLSAVPATVDGSGRGCTLLPWGS